MVAAADGVRGDERVAPDYGNTEDGEMATRTGSLDAELRSTLYPSELLHTPRVPINTTLPESSPILSVSLLRCVCQSRRPLIPCLIMEISDRMDSVIPFLPHNLTAIVTVDDESRRLTINERYIIFKALASCGRNEDFFIRRLIL